MAYIMKGYCYDQYDRKIVPSYNFAIMILFIKTDTSAMYRCGTVNKNGYYKVWVNVSDRFEDWKLIVMDKTDQQWGVTYPQLKDDAILEVPPSTKDLYFNVKPQNERQLRAFATAYSRISY